MVERTYKLYKPFLPAHHGTFSEPERDGCVVLLGNPKNLNPKNY